jgi:hypothetical protein
MFQTVPMVTNRPDVFPDFPDFILRLQNKINSHSRRQKSGNSTTYPIFNITHYNFMSNTIFQYKAMVVGSLLLCKIQLVPLVLLPSFLTIDANQTSSMILYLYRR